MVKYHRKIKLVIEFDIDIGDYSLLMVIIKEKDDTIRVHRLQKTE